MENIVHVYLFTYNTIFQTIKAKKSSRHQQFVSNKKLMNSKLHYKYTNII